MADASLHPKGLDNDEDDRDDKSCLGRIFRGVITPALLEAAVELKGAEYKIYGRLHGILSHGEYRSLKLWPLAQEMGMNKANVGKAMKRLVELGYIREGLRQENGGRSYMLVAVRGEPSKRSA